MVEWIRFWITAIFIAAGLICFAAEVIGIFKFDFVMNRMHAGGIGDTLGLFCIAAGLAVHAGPGFDLLKLFLVVCFMWMTSPTSSHMLSLVEYGTNKKLYYFMEREKEVINAPEGNGTSGEKDGPGKNDQGEHKEVSEAAEPLR